MAATACQRRALHVSPALTPDFFVLAVKDPLANIGYSSVAILTACTDFPGLSLFPSLEPPVSSYVYSTISTTASAAYSCFQPIAPRRVSCTVILFVFSRALIAEEGKVFRTPGPPPRKTARVSSTQPIYCVFVEQLADVLVR